MRTLPWFWCLLALVTVGAGIGIWRVQDSGVRHGQQHAERLAAGRLGTAVGGLVDGEHQLAAVLGAAHVTLGTAWSRFAAPLMDDPATHSVALVLPVTAAQRPRWSRRHHQPILQAEGGARFRPAPRRAEYWVLDQVAQRPGISTARVGTDLAENPVRREAMERATRASEPQATGRIRFLDEPGVHYGVISFEAIRGAGSRVLGWVATAIQASFFARQVTAVVHGARIAVAVGSAFLVDQPRALGGQRSTHLAGGQRWTTWIWVPRRRASAVPWLLLALLDVLAVIIWGALASSRARETYALDQVELHIRRERQRNDELERQRQILQKREAFLARVFVDAPFPKAVVDLDGRAIRVNDAFCELSGFSAAELLRRSLAELIDPEDRAVDAAAQAETLAGRSDGYRREQRMRHRDGSIRHVDTSVSLVRDDAGAPDFAVLQLRDITEQRRSQEDLRQARSHAEVITATMAEGYTLTDADGQIMTVNDAFCAMVGMTREELLGMRPPYMFWAPEGRERSPLIRAQMIASGGGDFEQELVRRSGERFAAEMTARPALNPDGSLVGVVTTIRDVSERRHQEAELERERRELYRAQALAHVGSWDHVPGSHPHRRWSPELWRIAGLEPDGAAPPPGTLMGLIHPEDKPEIDRIVAAALIAGQPWAAEFRIVNAVGRIVHVAVSAQYEPNADDDGSFARGTVQDITARARRDAEEQALRQIAELVAQAPDSEAVFEEVSRQTLELFEATSAYVIRFDHDRGRAICVAGQTDDGHRLDGLEFPLTDPGDLNAPFMLPERIQAQAAVDPWIDSALIERLGEGYVTAPIVVGARVWGRLDVTALRERRPVDLEDRLRRFSSLIAMAIANAETSDQLKRQALTDALTGLLNRRAFSARLRREIAVAEQTGHALSLAVIDLDHFKAVNDRYGHQCGDAVLVEFARRLHAAAGGGDAVARLGGEEFAWLMPNVGGTSAQEVLEAFASRSRQRTFAEAGVVTMSAGVHGYTPGEGIETLLREADEAVYAAKFAGRDRVALSRPRARSVEVDHAADPVPGMHQLEAAVDLPE